MTPRRAALEAARAERLVMDAASRAGQTLVLSPSSKYRPRLNVPKAQRRALQRMLALYSQP
jgi:hypothetical protein